MSNFLGQARYWSKLLAKVISADDTHKQNLNELKRHMDSVRCILTRVGMTALNNRVGINLLRIKQGLSRILLLHDNR